MRSSLKRQRKKQGATGSGPKGSPENVIPTHTVSKEVLDAFYGEGNWKQMPSETYKRLRQNLRAGL